MAPVLEGRPLGIREDENVRCVFRVPVGAADCWAFLFLPKLVKQVTQRSANPERCSALANGLMKGVLRTDNSTMAAYGAVMSAVRERGALTLMKQEETHLENNLKTVLLLRNYFEEANTEPQHKQIVKAKSLGDASPGMEIAYQALLKEMNVRYKDSCVANVISAYGLMDDTSENTILRRITAGLFIALGETDIPEDTNESRYKNFGKRQKEIKDAIRVYLGVEEVRSDFGEGEGPFRYQLETREENEIRIPIKERLSGKILGADIAVLGGISLLSNKRYLFDRLLKEGVPIRFVVTDPGSDGGMHAIRQFMDFSTEEEREEAVMFSISALSSRKKKYASLECKKTNLVLPEAIFIVYKEKEEESSVKVDLYSFRTNDDERRCLYITGADKKNFNYFKQQFEYIWQNANPIE